MKALDGERRLMPRAIEIGHKHANLQIVYSNFLLTDSHGTPLTRARIDNHYCDARSERVHYIYVV